MKAAITFTLILAFVCIPGCVFESQSDRVAGMAEAYGLCDGDIGYLDSMDLDGSGCIDLGDIRDLLAGE